MVPTFDRNGGLKGTAEAKQNSEKESFSPQNELRQSAVNAAQFVVPRLKQRLNSPYIGNFLKKCETSGRPQMESAVLPVATELINETGPNRPAHERVSRKTSGRGR